MDGPAGLMLFGAGLVGGIVTAVVGRASLITFPAMLAAGLPAISSFAGADAAASNCARSARPSSQRPLRHNYQPKP